MNYEANVRKVRKLIAKLDDDERWALKQVLAEPSRYYGDGGTIHHTTQLDIDTDTNGNVIAVWFRCQLLAFNQVWCDQRRTDDLRGAQGAYISGVEVVDEYEKYRVE